MYENEGKQREGEEEKINLLAAAAKISSKDKRAKRERAVCLRGGCRGEGCGTLEGCGAGQFEEAAASACAGHFHA